MIGLRNFLKTATQSAAKYILTTYALVATKATEKDILLALN